MDLILLWACNYKEDKIFNMNNYTLVELATRALEYAAEMKANGGKDIVKEQPPKEKKLHTPKSN